MASLLSLLMLQMSEEVLQTQWWYNIPVVGFFWCPLCTSWVTAEASKRMETWLDSSLSSEVKRILMSSSSFVPHYPLLSVSTSKTAHFQSLCYFSFDLTHTFCHGSMLWGRRELQTKYRLALLVIWWWVVGTPAGYWQSIMIPLLLPRWQTTNSDQTAITVLGWSLTLSDSMIDSQLCLHNELSQIS